MSALTDLFTAMANKIRTKTGTQTTYTPSEMVSDGIDDVYDAGVASATTPITPSNASPAGMTANVGYKPTANGYAVENYDYVYPSNLYPHIVQKHDVCVIDHPGAIVDSIMSVTPSNSSPIRIDTDRIVKPTNNAGYVIQSYDSVTPSSTPTSVASGDIVKIGGSGVIVDSIPTPTSITPSDSNPASLTANTPVTPSANGYAIASNPTSLTPSNSSPATISSGTIYNASAGGKAVESVRDVTPSPTPTSVSADDIVHIGGSGKIVDAISDVTPSDSSPVSLTSGLTYKMGGGGYAIEHSPTSLTPADSTNPPSIASGTIYKGGGSGYAVASKPSALSPSDSSPVAISDGGMYLASGGGYAIESQPSNKTPDDTTPPSVTSGEIVKMGGAGYLYATQHGSNFAVAENKSVSSSDYAGSFTFSNYSGKSLLVLIRAAGSSSMAYNRFDNCTATGGTLTKLANEFGANSYGYGTFFQFDITSDTATISLPSSNKGYMIAFGIT